MDVASLWLDAEPSVVSQPSVTRKQTLPFGELSWGNFERLCLELARRGGNVEDARIYGTSGQAQDGIDLYVRQTNGEYATWQSKRHRAITTANLKEFVTKFLEGEWAKRTKLFRLAVSSSLNDANLAEELERQRERCRIANITFESLDAERLSQMLKEHVDLVDDFFGRTWAEEFNGREAVSGLSSKKLTREQKAQARSVLRTLYDSHFQTVDGGIPAAAPAFRGAVKRVAVFDRYVEPSVELIESIIETSSPADQQPRLDGTKTVSSRTKFRRRDIGSRMLLSDGLATTDRIVLLGGAGLGKSAALRVVIHDLLGEETRFPAMAKRLGRRLPLLVPFAFLSRYFTEHDSPTIDSALRSWLQVLGARDEVLTLLENMVADDRLLLLIDGLDEWQNRDAAVTAVTALISYAQTRRLPLIATARPLGFEQISNLGPEWVRAVLLPLSGEEQRTFASYWFRHFHDSGSKLDPKALQQAVERDARDFERELADDPDLCALSGVPLLLGVLIYLRLSNRAMPHSRLAALEELVKALLEDQPSLRAQAAMQSVDRAAARSRYVRRGLEYLAYCIHQEPSSLVLSNDRAAELLKTYFQTEQQLSANEAEEWSAKVLELGQGDFGVLVAAQQGHVGLLHRLFQEFLAAKYLSRLPLERARLYCVGLGLKGSWHEVTSTLIQLLDRPDDVDQLLDVLRSPVVEVLGQSSQQILIARLAAANSNASKGKLTELVQDVFCWIEYGRWMPLRLALVREIVQGLDSEQIGSLITARAKRWFPGRVRWLHEMPAAAIMEAGEEAVTNLWIAFHNCDSGYDFRQIVEALLAVRHLRPTLEDDFLSILKCGAEPELMAAALHGLSSGWPANAALPELLTVASVSPAKELRLIAWLQRFSRGERGDDVRDGLVHFCMQDQRPWVWGKEVMDALVQAWPREPEFKKRALERIRGIGFPGSWEPKPALEYLLRAYPGDDEVAEMIVTELKRGEQDPRRKLNIGDMRGELLAGFAHHARIVPVAEDWLTTSENVRFSPLDVAIVARLGGTVKCQTALLDWLRKGKPMPAWIISTLEEMVGPDDASFQAALVGYIADERRRSDAGRWLHIIIRDSKQLSDALRDILRGKDVNDSHSALGRLLELEGKDAPNLWTTVEEKLTQDNEGHYWRLGHRILLRAWPEQPLLRARVKATVYDEDVDRKLIYEIYGRDPEIRGLLDSALCVLHEDLRFEMAKAIEPLVRREVIGAVEIAASFKQEPNAETRTVAVRAYARHCFQRSRQIEDLTASLVNDLTGFFTEQDARRQAAVAGFLELGRADLIDSRQEFGGPIRLSSYSRASHNWEFVASVVQNWEQMVGAIPEIWDRLGHSPVIATELAKSGKGAQVMSQIKHYEEGVRSGKLLEIEEVRALIAIHGRSEFLRDLFAERLRHFRTGRPQSMMVIEGEAYHAIGAYLGDHFHGDARLLPIIQEVAASGMISDVGMVTLCRGWPDAPEVVAAAARLAGYLDNGGEPVTAWLFAAKATTEQMVSYVMRYPSKLREEHFHDPRQGLAAVRSRLESDHFCRESVFDQLKKSTDPIIFIGVGKLLAPTMRHERVFRDWVSERLRVTRQTPQALAPLAFDVFLNRPVPVEHSLLETALTQ